MTILDYLNDHSKKRGDKIAIKFNDKNITYRSLHDLSTNLGNSLLASQFKKGDKIIIFLPEIYEYIISYIGILKAGCVAVPLCSFNLEKNIEQIICKIKPAGIIFDNENSRTVIDIINEYNINTKFIVTGNEAKNNAIAFDDLIKNNFPYIKTNYPDENTETMIIFDSGTYSSPKGAILNHKVLMKSTESILTQFKISHNDKLGSFFKCGNQNFHTLIINSAIISGATILLNDNKDLTSKIQEYFNHGITILLGSAFSFTEFFKNNHQNYIGSSLRLGIITFDPKNNEIIPIFKERIDVELVQVFSTIETTSIFAYTNINGDYNSTLLGNPVNNVELNIVDESGKELFTNEIGELAVRSPMNMLAYENEYDISVKDSQKWVYPGSICSLNETGSITIVGNKNDIIYKGRFPVYAVEIESCINSNNSVSESAVVGISDSERHQEIKAFVKTEENVKMDSEELLKYCALKLPKYKCPKIIEFVDSFTKDEEGKIIKRFYN